MNLVFLVLCSAFVHSTLTSSDLREFIPGGEENKMDQPAAWLSCEKKQSTLATVYDDDDIKVISSLIKNYDAPKMAWIGLHRRDNVTTWSDRTPFKFSGKFNISSVNVTDGKQRCGAIVNTEWKDFNCSDKKPFMCYKDNKYTLVEKEMNWCEARRYCRKYHTDLVSISNDTQEQEVIRAGEEKSSFWIGLLHDEWEWENDECSTFREWHEHSSGESNVTALFGSPPKLYKYTITNSKPFLCSRGNGRIKVINQPLRWEETFDYCKDKYDVPLWIDSDADQRAVEQWLKGLNVSGPFWLGLRQSRIFGFWIWTTDRVVGYSNWKDGTPPEPPLSNYCGAIDKEDDHKWSDKDCQLKLPFLCIEYV